MPSPKYASGGVPPIWESPIVQMWGRGPGGLGAGGSSETYGPTMKNFQYAANMDERGMKELAMLIAAGALAGKYGQFIKEGTPADVVPGTIGGIGAGAAGTYFGKDRLTAGQAMPEAWKSLGPEWSQEAANEQLFGPRFTIMNILSALGRLGQRR